PWFDGPWIEDPAAQVVGRIVDNARAECRPTAHVREVRTNIRGGRQTAYRVTGDTRVLEEDLLATRARWRHRLTLLLDPRVELIGRFGYHPNAHPRMLEAAVLVTIAVVHPSSVHQDRHAVCLAWHQILHPAKLRHVKAVDYVDRLERHLQRRARWNVQLVRRSRLEVRIDVLPPPLMPDHAQWPGAGLVGIHRPNRGDDEHEDDGQQHRRADGPDHFQAAIPVPLGRFGRITRRGSKTRERDHQHADDQRQQQA